MCIIPLGSQSVQSCKFCLNVRNHFTAISQTLANMLKEGLVIEEVNPEDRRQKQLKLTTQGKLLVQALEPVWEKAERVFSQLQTESGLDLLAHLTRLEECLTRQSITQRYQEIDP